MDNEDDPDLFADCPECKWVVGLLCVMTLVVIVGGWYLL